MSTVLVVTLEFFGLTKSLTLYEKCWKNCEKATRLGFNNGAVPERDKCWLILSIFSWHKGQLLGQQLHEKVNFDFVVILDCLGVCFWHFSIETDDFLCDCRKFFSSNVKRTVFTFFLSGCWISNLGGPNLVGQAALSSSSELHEPEKVNKTWYFQISVRDVITPS